MNKRAALYVRVSTDGQTTENQRRELKEVADKSGWKIVEIYEDAGISGAKGRDKRPAFNKLLQDATRRKFDMVAAWSVDRLGRSMPDLVGFLNELKALNIDLYLQQQALDTSTPAGRAFFQMLGIFAEFERSMIQERVKAGLARARAESPAVREAKGKKAIGRPQLSQRKRREIIHAREGGLSIRKTAASAKVSTATVQKVLNDQLV
ncbi:recombinase family protein [Parasphingorhabdus flavimaris]|uniref:recombinase family protein n=1 Tax=Parasphingorhabdus flavimaris TaxID=266812 RepID=UPI003001C974